MLKVLYLIVPFVLALLCAVLSAVLKKGVPAWFYLLRIEIGIGRLKTRDIEMLDEKWRLMLRRQILVMMPCAVFINAAIGVGAIVKGIEGAQSIAIVAACQLAIAFLVMQPVFSMAKILKRGLDR